MSITTPIRRFTIGIAAALCAIAGAECSKGSPTSPTPPPPGGGPPPGSQTAVLIGAGDIGQCGSPGTIATGRLVEATLGDVFLAGDIAYPNGTMANFQQCFDPFWGHARDRWHPVPGNHEYESPNAGPYFQYFAQAAGSPSVGGYYRFQAGDWAVLMLNSNIPANRGSSQYEFVRQSLTSRPTPCALAIWHHPLFTSGPNGPQTFMREMWLLLYEQNVDVIINGHDHLYERFSRQDPDGRLDERGIRQFTVGTGGADLYRFVTVAPNSGARIATFGIFKITLRPDSYDWEFLETSGALGDNGFTACH